MIEFLLIIFIVVDILRKNNTQFISEGIIHRYILKYYYVFSDRSSILTAYLKNDLTNDFVL
jgi:hypothetical protein